MNIREIAKKADVSIATVSRVLNNSENVSSSTREKVLEILKKYEFEMDPWAKRLASKRNVTHVFIMVSRRILRFLDLKGKEFYSVVVNGIQNAANMNRSVTKIVEMETNLDEEKLKGVDGVLLVGGDTTAEHVRFFKKIGMPLVLVDQYIPTVKVDCVVSNGYDGASYAVKYLISQHFKKIVHIHGFLNHFGFKDRYNGYVATMEQNNLLPKDYEYNDEVMEDMKPLMDKMFNIYGVPEAIFASNDSIAMKVIETLMSFHIKVPEDVSVIGFDGIEKGKHFTPSLSTLKVPMHEMGSLALKRLIDIVYNQDVYPVKISLFTEFIKRGSSI